MKESVMAGLASGIKKAKVRFYSSIRAAAGTSGLEVELPVGCTVYTLLKLLSDDYGDAFRNELFMQTGGGLRDDLIISVNGVISGHESAISEIISDCAVIDLLTTFPGGG